MRKSSLGLAAVIALGLCATTSAKAALTVVPPVVDNPSIVLAACAPGWFRGPGRLCYPYGYYGGYPYGYYGGGGYYRHRFWHHHYYGYRPWRRYYGYY